MDAAAAELTRLFQEMDAGSQEARDAMLAAVYSQLRVIAAARMSQEVERSASRLFAAR